MAIARRALLLSLTAALAFFPPSPSGICADEVPPAEAGLVAPDPVVADPAEPTDGEPAVAEITGPRDLLSLLGIDESFFDHLLDGGPIEGGEKETLRKVIFRLPDFSLLDLSRWARAIPDPDKLAAESESLRGEVFRLAGRLVSVEVREMIPELVDRYEFDRYYRCEVRLSETRQPAVVFTRHLPKAWEEADPMDERISAYGLLLKLAGDEQQPTPVFAAPRLGWHPDTLLGNLGMDVGLLDEVRNRTGLTGHDREAFYQMLAAVARAEPGRLLDDARSELAKAGEDGKRVDDEGVEHFSVVPLFNEADAQRGRLMKLSGVARRVLRVPVADPDIIERFGIREYYNVYLFTDDSQDNPVVFCVSQLPPGMPTGDGPDYGEFVEVAGFFFKTWGYRVPTTAFGPDSPGVERRMQLAPLLIGRQPVWVESQGPIENALIGAIAGGLFVVTLTCIWLALWAYGRGDKRFREQTLSKSYAMDSGISLNEIGLDADGTPDFSGLEEMERRAGEQRDE